MSAMTIGKLSKSTGIGIETIRYYEREGLIEEPNRRESSGYREYDPSVVVRLSFIRRAKDLGFSLKEIKELLSIRAKIKAKCGSAKKKAEAKIADVEEKIKDLERIKRSLSELVSQCNEELPTSECPILDALEYEESS